SFVPNLVERLRNFSACWKSTTSFKTLKDWEPSPATNPPGWLGLVPRRQQGLPARACEDRRLRAHRASFREAFVRRSGWSTLLPLLPCQIHCLVGWPRQPLLLRMAVWWSHGRVPPCPSRRLPP